MTFNALRRVARFALAALTALLAGQAGAFTITAFSPQGEVARVNQVVAKFSEDMVRFGDPRAAAPFDLRCDTDVKAQSRWTSAREWVTDFASDLPPGVRCTAQAVEGLQSLAGGKLAGRASYRFDTGGPFVRRIRPYDGSTIEEEQAFILQLNGNATADSIKANVWCDLEGVGERVPVRLIEGKQRDELMHALDLDKAAARAPGQYYALQCARRLTPASKMELVYGKGVATPSGIANTVEKRFPYTVREPFTVSTTCQRENAHADCIPITPISVLFSAPISTKVIDQIHLRSDAAEFPATYEKDENEVSSLQFAGPFPERTTLNLTLPADLKDVSGRPLVNATAGPIKIAVGPLPPLAKFSSGAFGIIERFAEGPDGPALLPLTLRYTDSRQQNTALELHELDVRGDADIIAWFTRVRRYDNSYVSRGQAERDVRGPLPPPVNDGTKDDVETRTVSLLHGREHVQTLKLPPPPKSGLRPFEVIGVPLAPGFHVVEASSELLGQALLDDGYGADRRMYVRTAALVTNLGVHFKLGRENALAWVTTLDTGEPVPGASVQISDCRGKRVAHATTDADGVASFKGVSPQAPNCTADDNYVGDFQNAYFVSARAENHGTEDMAFTWSSWQRGIESWRFNVPTSSDPAPDVRAHTLFDRTLFRTGEKVSMEHLLRTETDAGFGLPGKKPATLVITHVGSGQAFEQPLKWRSTATGGLSAESTFTIPKAAKLGLYRVALKGEDDAGNVVSYTSGEFRVEEFRLPVYQGKVAPTSSAPLIAPGKIPVQVQINYISGGPAGNLPVQVSATTRTTIPDYVDYDAFSFNPPRSERGASDDSKVVADKLRATLNQQGLGDVTIDGLEPSTQPQHLTLEATYSDPNGEIQTLSSSRTIWPAAVIAGIKADSWVSAGRSAKVQALALDLDGKPMPKVAIDVRAMLRVTTTTRKRMVGGFYTYDSHTDTKDLGTVCTGKSDEHGVMACTVSLTDPGEIELVAKAHDSDGRTSLAATSVWVTKQGELWFGGNDDDRMDVLPEKKHYEPGDTARFQVRMPFRHATALVAVEREGILSHELVKISGDDPTISLKVEPNWGPNVYVSVLALRGRIYHAPWYSFFTWGYKAPRQWWQAFTQDNKDYVAPTALIDLSKPAFRFGMAELKVGTAAHQLLVSVKTDHDTYQIRDTAKVTITVTQPDGKPAAGAEVAVAAVDQALLELMPNRSWDVLPAMLVRRAWGVQTSTAEMQIVGRRHYGRKAVPSGGGGGKSQTRELFDTLLLWKPAITLDEKGQAQIEVPLNDSLTTFQIVAVADMGTGLFGTGETAIHTKQDLQIISGLPPLVREGDRFQAMLTLRNSTDKAMKVEVEPHATLLTLEKKTVDIPANSARGVDWDVTAPLQPIAERADSLAWEIRAYDLDSKAQDAVKVTERIIPAVPITIQQGTLVQLDSPFTLDVAPPADALPAEGAKRGGLLLALQPKLATGLPAIRDWFARYPYSCLEQLTSKAIGMDDMALWQKTMASLPTYLDNNGLAYYFPPRSGDNDNGSDTLTAWLLSATDEASRINPAYRLPADAVQSMTKGLADFVAGRIQRKFWSPRNDLDERKLAAIAALARYNAAKPEMVSSIAIAPNQWPTSAVLDWISILQRVQGIPKQAAQLEQAEQILRARVSVQGTRLVFSTERDDDWWWLMEGGDVNAARLLLAVMNDPAWKDDVGRLVTGFIARQNNGAWRTTTANLWGKLALQEFSREHERAPVTGSTRATYGNEHGMVDWARVRPVKNGEQAPFSRFYGAPASPGQLTNNTMFLPWSTSPKDALVVTQSGSGKPWLTLQSLAAVQLKAPFAAGYQIKKTITPIEQAKKDLPAGHYSRGDILRITLEVTGAADMTWVAVTDPIPAGATILGSGLGRDSAIATEGEKRKGWAWPAFEERSFESFRSYYQYVPKGTFKMEYTVRLNNAGDFQLPPSRVEALYAPEMFGESPNATVHVDAQ
ncbi:MAG: alpha-2-macroglobulin [Burkholderiaceae bacterium]|nr:MAG: alpha-2-macroglobulin [Burkholderiaceae bacterium]